MSYDLMVFEPTAAPRKRAEFLKWFQKQTKWAESHGYDDPKVSSPALQEWFREMIKSFPPMNGPLSSEDNVDKPEVTSYSVGSVVIYAGFASSCANEAHAKTKALARKHKVGFFDVSADDGEILFPTK